MVEIPNQGIDLARVPSEFIFAACGAGVGGVRNLLKLLLRGLGLSLLCKIPQGLGFAPRSGAFRKARDLGVNKFTPGGP